MCNLEFWCQQQAKALHWQSFWKRELLLLVLAGCSPLAAAALPQTQEWSTYTRQAPVVVASSLSAKASLCPKDPNSRLNSRCQLGSRYAKLLAMDSLHKAV